MFARHCFAQVSPHAARPGASTTSWVPWRTVIWGLGLVSGVMGVFAPYKSYVIYLLVTLIALPIGLVVSNLVLGVLYYGVLTPLALEDELVLVVPGRFGHGGQD